MNAVTVTNWVACFDKHIIPNVNDPDSIEIGHRIPTTLLSTYLNLSPEFNKNVQLPWATRFILHCSYAILVRT